MPRNGSGSYSLPSGNPVVTGTTISSTVQNNTLSDIATALTASLAKDGQTTPTANLPMGGFKHTGAANGSAATDYATISNLQSGTGSYVSTVGGTANAITLTPSPAISAYAAGQSFSFIAALANTSSVTVAISGLTTKAITKNGTTALSGGEILANALVVIEYDGTQFQLVSISTGPVTTSGLTMATSKLLGRTTASTGAIEEITVGTGLSLSGGSLTAAGVFTRQVFTTGSGTYTTPANCRVINIRMLGGGGGGAASNTNSGNNGNNTTFSTLTAGGGSAGGTSGIGSGGGNGGTATNGDINIPGGSGSAGNPSSGVSQASGGGGGSSVFGGGGGGGASGGAGKNAATNSGGGGGGAGQTGSASGGGGGAGGYVEKRIASPSATYSYAVGTGGAGGTAGGFAGGNGADGIIIVDEYY